MKVEVISKVSIIITRLNETGLKMSTCEPMSKDLFTISTEIFEHNVHHSSFCYPLILCPSAKVTSESGIKLQR